MTKNNRLVIAIGADHRGFILKEYLINQNKIDNKNIIWLDMGTDSTERTDYPIYTFKVVNKILNNQADLGILICGSGIGMSIAANRFKNIYAGLVWDKASATLAKEDDNVNILVLPADFLNQEQSLSIVSAWLSAKFKKNRYADRLKMIDNICN